MIDGNTDNIFKNIRIQVGKTLEMAEADSKLSDENRDLLSQLILTRRGDGEVVLDIGALQRIKASQNQWSDKERDEQNRFVNPTRLPQILPGLGGLSASQYLAFVQRPLEQNGDNGPFLEKAALRLAEQYQDKQHAQEKANLFGPAQRKLAKQLLDEVVAKEKGLRTAEEIEAFEKATPAQEQFELAAQSLGISAADVMNRLYKMAVALTLVERIKAKALKIKQSEEKFGVALRKLINSDSGPTSQTRVKELFIGFKKDLERMGYEFTHLQDGLSPLSEKMAGNEFDASFSTLHRAAARLDAISSRWVIIINEANNPDQLHTPVEKIKGMHRVFTDDL